MTKFNRIVDVGSSRNWIKENPARNYGVTTNSITFVLVGSKGAVQWMIGTEWASGPVRAHLEKFDKDEKLSRFNNPRIPRGWDLGYHSKKPRFKDQQPNMTKCQYTGGKCYYDGSSLQADALIEGFLAGGTEWLWPKLEEYYRYIFKKGPYPDFSPVYQPHPDDRQ